MEVGLTIDEFWQLTWREFLLYRIAFENRQVKEWERTRLISYMLYRANTTDSNPKSLKSFMPLPTDAVEDDTPKLTQEQLAETLKMYGVN